ncbi:GNAT family N-acetyltransferase [Curtobacterium ammoniigenes]|uniref:GNAT family N-acetyltransferase n=1 Tax=Curtobacterium ammoniigenes TaxID=395387 RepID=UPI00082B9663|nr:GNAT family protein [Curtobacterium ammoniigenes]
MGIGPLSSLVGDRIALEALEAGHADDLRLAVDDGQLWRIWYTNVPAPDGVDAEIERLRAAAQAGTVIPFAVRDRPTGRVVGATSFLNIDRLNRRVEIGGTYLAQSAQRSGVNTEMKLLMLAHAFDTWDCIAVEFRTHWHNRQSRAAIERLGAKQDGVLRNHRLGPDGSRRDTVVYSILDSEWPTVRLALREQLRLHDRRAGARHSGRHA